MNGVEQSGGFIIRWSEGMSSNRPAGLEKYELAFYVEDIGLAYVVDYELDPVSAQGFVYLPGPDDSRYTGNAKSILRGGFEGNWFHASPEWQKLVIPFLAR